MCLPGNQGASKTVWPLTRGAYFFVEGRQAAFFRDLITYKLASQCGHLGKLGPDPPLRRGLLLLTSATR